MYDAVHVLAHALEEFASIEGFALGKASCSHPRPWRAGERIMSYIKQVGTGTLVASAVLTVVIVVVLVIVVATGAVEIATVVVKLKGSCCCCFCQYSSQLMFFTSAHLPNTSWIFDLLCT